MRFIETSVFTRRITELIDDQTYQNLQLAMLFRPNAGLLIPRSGGLRKIRWSKKGQGKRGGIRVIYFWHEATETYLMLLVYAKNEQENLTSNQLRSLKRAVQEQFE